MSPCSDDVAVGPLVTLCKMTGDRGNSGLPTADPTVGSAAVIGVGRGHDHLCGHRADPPGGRPGRRNDDLRACPDHSRHRPRSSTSSRLPGRRGIAWQCVFSWESFVNGIVAGGHHPRFNRGIRCVDVLGGRYRKNRCKPRKAARRKSPHAHQRAESASAIRKLGDTTTARRRWPCRNSGCRNSRR